MKLEDQVVSLPLAIKLKEAGIKHDSLFAYYGNAGTWHDAIVSMDMYTTVDDEFREHKLLPAYTSGELAVLLPDYDIIHKEEGFQIRCNDVVADGAPKLADAMAEMLLHLNDKE